MHEGCRKARGLADELKVEVIDKELKLRVYNEIRETVIAVYLETRKQNGGDDQYEQILTNGNFNDVEVLKTLEEDDGKFDTEAFIIKMSVIHDEWKKRKARKVVPGEGAGGGTPGTTAVFNKKTFGGGTPQSANGLQTSPVKGQKQDEIVSGSRSQLSRKGTSISKGAI